jgi:DNA topoisomerase IA
MSNTKKRYLIIAEKPSVAKYLRDIYAKMGDQANFDADIVPANNHVFNINDRLLVNDDNRNAILSLPVLRLKDHIINEDFRVDTEGMWAGNGRRIASLVNRNQYDVIVNACDQDEEGELTFQYVIESMGLENFETRRLILSNLYEANVVDALIALNN